MGGWNEVKLWRFECDGCKNIKRQMAEQRPFDKPEGWAKVERAGGGHYGLPIHTYWYCPACQARGKHK